MAGDGVRLFRGKQSDLQNRLRLDPNDKKRTLREGNVLNLIAKKCIQAEISPHSNCVQNLIKASVLNCITAQTFRGIIPKYKVVFQSWFLKSRS